MMAEVEIDNNLFFNSTLLGSRVSKRSRVRVSNRNVSNMCGKMSITKSGMRFKSSFTLRVYEDLRGQLLV